MTTTQVALLASFLANEWEIRDGLKLPFKIGRWVYATNGHVAVRVPADTMPEVPERNTTQPKNVADLFDKWHAGVEGEFLLMPPLPPLVDCPMCHGTGVVHEEYGPEQCNNCFGNGHDWTYHAIGDAGFNLLYLHQLAALPQARIRTNGMNAAAVLFDGGQALVMPMKEKK